MSLFTDEAAATIDRTRRLFEARLEHCGYDHALEEFLEAEAAALDSAPDYAEHLDRLRLYQAVWSADVVRH